MKHDIRGIQTAFTKTGAGFLFPVESFALLGKKYRSEKQNNLKMISGNHFFMIQKLFGNS
jgi:hypothetical protein